MIKKVCQKISILTMMTAIVGCSSNSTHHSQKNEYLNTEIAQFGAITHGRQFVPFHTALFSATPQAIAQMNVVNQGDFLTQLSYVKNYSQNLNSRFADLYANVTAWVATGADIKQLSRYGIQTLQMRGEDGYQNVLMTGYYSPVIQARTTPQGKYRHPIYALPAKKHFTRSQIYAGALAGKGLELAYSDSMMDNFLLGVQGSGYVDFGNGNLQYLAYAGQNGFKYTSIGRLLVEDGVFPKEKMSIQAIREWGKKNPHQVQKLLERNASYVFFKKDPSGQVKGSAGVPLVALASVASDRNVVPSGSVLLVEMPLIDYHGNWTGKFEIRLMIALDVGGAVKGQHFDIYQGIGNQAGHQAGLMKHYGRVWVLK